MKRAAGKFLYEGRWVDAKELERMRREAELGDSEAADALIRLRKRGGEKKSNIIAYQLEHPQLSKAYAKLTLVDYAKALAEEAGFVPEDAPWDEKWKEQSRKRGRISTEPGLLVIYFPWQNEQQKERLRSYRTSRSEDFYRGNSTSSRRQYSITMPRIDLASGKRRPATAWDETYSTVNARVLAVLDVAPKPVAAAIARLKPWIKEQFRRFRSMAEVP